MGAGERLMAGGKRVLFVTYGGGHVSMVVPVALACRGLVLDDVHVLALTSAAHASRAAGLRTWQFRDFVTPDDAQALAWGDELAGTLEPGGTVEPAETRAYLGLSFAEMVQDMGEAAARERYRAFGRHQFLPVRVLERILRRLAPDVVVITNSPRAEWAAGIAARRLGIPALCINSMFAIDEIAWLGQPGFCDRLCVLNEEVRQRFIAAGRAPGEVVVTGNPSFDTLFAPEVRDAGLALRARLPFGTRQIVLWASQPEYVSHPTAPGLVGDPALPLHILHEMLAWAQGALGRHVIVRPHPNERIDDPGLPCATMVTAADCDVAVTLHACDIAATMTSTVALQAHALRVPVLQVRGSIFDHSMPLAAMGIATECAVPDVAPKLQRMFATPGLLRARGGVQGGGAAAAVAAQVVQLLARQGAATC